MNDEDYSAFGEKLILMAHTFRAATPQRMIEGYWQALKPFDWRHVNGAIDDCIETSERFPTPAALINAVNNLKASEKGIHQNNYTKPNTAWLTKQIASNYCYCSHQKQPGRSFCPACLQILSQDGQADRDTDVFESYYLAAAATLKHKHNITSLPPVETYCQDVRVASQDPDYEESAARPKGET